MVDPYLYDDVPVLKNKLDIKSEQTLDQIEAEQSRANMMLYMSRASRIFHQLDYVKSIGFFLAISMIGPAITGLSI